ncbi:MAG: GntR family transcriptional regulator [Chloroflexi bacterium]|nr:GntR family transcriptional regulator [Chloroflexota bacterium]
MGNEFHFQLGGVAYLQIAEHIRTQVALGKMLPGARLPAIRELAQRLHVDPGTVARAYRHLESEGTIIGRHGSGSFVATVPTEGPQAKKLKERLETAVDRTILEALGLGFDVEDIQSVFTLRLAQWRTRREAPARRADADRRTVGEAVRFVGSHDIAVELLASQLNMLYPQIRLEPSFVGSLAGLVALEYCEADIVGAHLFDEETGQFNIPFVKRLLPNESVALINLVQRVQGFMVPRGNPKQVLGVPDLKRSDITFVNRQKGSGTRVLLDSWLLKQGIRPSEVKGYEHEEATHLAVASLVAQGKADIGLGAQSAASVAEVDFIPLMKERYDLILLEENLETEPVRTVRAVVESDSFNRMLAAVPGHDVTSTGELQTIRPGISGKEQVRQS